MPTPSRAIVIAMAPERRRGPARGAGRAVLLAWVIALAGPAGAQAPGPSPPQRIFSCIDANGKKITSDRPIPDCNGKEQRELNPDGSFRRNVPPPPTADEQSDIDQRERKAAADHAAQRDAERRDRNLMQRFPDEAAHNRARAKALDDVANSVRISETRIALLTAERKPLLDEAEFYVGKSLPSKLKLSLDANDASLEAQKSLVQNQKSEVARINALYDAELVRLRKLWGGAPAGSLGPTPGAPAPRVAPVPEASAKTVGVTLKSPAR
jgi:hypothetical protein